MAWEAYGIALAKTALSSLIKVFAPRLLSAIQLNTRRAYLRNLRSSILEMPLLYRGTKLTVLADFVDVQLMKVDNASTINSTPNPTGQVSSTTFGTGISYRKLILFGAAGIGKTTFCRRAALELIEGSPSVRRLITEDGLTPIFVPLKAISNRIASPVVSYITQTQRYFGGARGMRRLCQLAEKRALVLFLDGYDEIPYIGGQDFIQGELNLLLANEVTRSTNPLYAEELTSLYSNLQHCRIWISSRIEFFKAFPLTQSKNTGTVSARGLPNNGIALVGILFDHYRKEFPDYVAEQLHEESFMRDLQLYGTDSIRDLAHSPLFLTVICHTYANDLKERRPPQAMWKRGADEIIHRCVHLLLLEIDEYKTRDLNHKDRTALLDRRSSWPEVKLAVLRYIAGNSYRDGRTLLSTSHITEYSAACVQQMPESEERSQILAGLSRDDPSTNLAAQIILSGVLLRVRGADNDVLYDFPHRRFRELLAVEFFSNPAGARFLAENTSLEGMSQLVLLFVEATTYWPVVVDGIANTLLTTHSDSQNQAVLLAYAIDRISDRGALHSLVCSLLQKALTQRRYPRLYLHSIARSLDRTDSAFVATLAEQLSSSAAAGDIEACQFIFPLLREISLAMAEKTVCQIFESQSTNAKTKWQVCAMIGGMAPHILETAARTLIQESPDGGLGVDSARFLGLLWVGETKANRETVEGVLMSHLEGPGNFRQELELVADLLTHPSVTDDSPRGKRAAAQMEQMLAATRGQRRVWRTDEVPKVAFNF